MNISEAQKFAEEFVTNPKYGFLHEEAATVPELAGLQFFDLPLTGFAAAENEYYKSIIDNDEANIDLAQPRFWLEDAKTVVSFFFPFSERLRKSNRPGGQPSLEWLHGRVQGQQFMQAFIEGFRDLLIGEGYEALIPQLDERFWQNTRPRHTGPDGRTRRQFSTNWSERHVAFGAGLGTFGLAGNLITEKGTAGRLVSLVTTAEIDGAHPISLSSELPELFGNCTMCGVCKKRCPNEAIGELGKKEIPKCFKFMGTVSSKNKGLHGCGMCQVAIPCEFRIPARKA
jgi:epoxyqueuosine reductase QueG